MHKRIAVLITCYNRVEKTLKCLEKLFESEQYLKKDLQLEVYLVDDNSPDQTGSIVKNRYPLIHIIYGTGQLFWNRGMHLSWGTAAKYYDYDFYLWLNDDTILFENALEKLLKVSEIFSNKVILCGPTKSKLTNETTYGGRKMDGILLEPNGQLEECELINGNCVLIPKVVFKTIGNLDNTFHHSLGDFDYGLRAKKKGFKNYMLGEHVGFCERNARIPDWFNANINLKNRLKSFVQPLAVSPREFFIYNFRHFGFLKALKYYFLIWIRVFLPFLWK